MIQLKDGSTTEDPRLDRLVQFDERSRAYPIRAVVPKKPRSYTWRCKTYLDQGSEGACVGFSWAHEIAARPKESIVQVDTARKIYQRAQQIDEWPGEAYEGTSVIAGAKAAVELGAIKEYRWAFGLEDLVLAIGYTGPVILGVNWYSGMFNTDEKGFIKPDGYLAGGHAILANGVNVKSRYVKLHNSWGPHWGKQGSAYITFDDLNRLLQEKGEACVPLLRSFQR